MNPLPQNRALRHKIIVFSVCLALAVGMYFNYRASLVSSVNYVVPIELTLPPRLILTYQEPQEVRLTISGRETLLADISAAQVKARVDLSSFEQGNWSVPIQIDEGILRKRKLKVEWQPNDVAVKLEELASKQVSIQGRLVGSPPTGYFLENYQLTPAATTVNGPASVVETISQLSSEPVDITGRNKSFQATVAIQIPHPLLDVSPSRVTYTVNMQEQTGVLTLSVPISLENLAGRLQASELQPAVVGVTLSGGQLSLARLGSGEQGTIIARVDAGEIANTGRYILPVSVSTPPGFEIIKIEPSNATLFVRLQQAIPGDRNAPTAPILPGPLSNNS